MLDTIVRYLHDSLIPFRLSSYPSMEHVPKAVQPIPKEGLLIDTQLVTSAGQPLIACWPADGELDFAALSNALGSSTMAASAEDLPESLRYQEGPPPPLGQLFGLPVIVDEAVSRAGVIVFRPFGESDFIEIPYDDFARQEQPRVASFSRAGELTAAPPEHAGAAPH